MGIAYLNELVNVGVISSPLWVPILLVSLLSISKSFRNGQYYNCWLLSLFISSVIVFIFGIYIWNYVAHGATVLFILSLGFNTASIALNIFFVFVLYTIKRRRDSDHA